MLRPSSSRRDTLAAAYCSAEPDESHKLAFLGMLGAPRVRRLSNPPPPAEEQPHCYYERPVLPRAQATETKNSVLRPRAKGDAGAVVTWCLSTHHTEAIRRMYNLIYRKG
mgnify:CR=1 FL=1